MHKDIARPWTVDTLADEARLSRSAFALRFRERVGQAPLEYLTRWRMFKAGHLPRDRRHAGRMALDAARAGRAAGTGDRVGVAQGLAAPAQPALQLLAPPGDERTGDSDHGQRHHSATRKLREGRIQVDQLPVCQRRNSRRFSTLHHF